MSTISSLPSSALSASRAALATAMADNAEANGDVSQTSDEHVPRAVPRLDTNVQTPVEEKEPGEIQEVNMESQADEIRTVFNDPERFNVKHPLYSPWTLWFDSPATKGRNLPQTPSAAFPQTPATPSTAVTGGWMDDIKRVITFDSVEEFWGLYNNIIPPSKLPQKANYYLFKDGIIPAWEDDANKNGGKWSIQLPKDKNRANVDKMWLYTMLAAIGETFDPALQEGQGDDAQGDNAEAVTPLITGVIVSSRPQFYRLSIWTRLAPATPSDTDPLRQRIEAIGRHFKTNVLEYQESQKLAGPLATEVEFMSHKDSEKKGKGKKIIV